MITLYNDDCFNIFPKIKNGSVDLFLLDLPYGQTGCEWDTCIDLKKMWQEIKRTIKTNGQVIFFCTTKFGNTLINSNPNWFRYDLIWEKSKSVGFLNAKKAPLRKHEMIYIFGNYKNDDLTVSRNLELRAYAQKVKDYINKPLREIDAKIGNQGIHHFYCIKTTQFGIPIKKNYDKLTEIYQLEKMEGYMTHEALKSKWITEGNKRTYNPQKTKGKPYKARPGSSRTMSLYDIKDMPNRSNETGDRHPTSIIKFNQPYRSSHPTQKPTELLEWLIKSYTNEGDLVCDFTMGSGSTGVACKNTNRNFIGVELTKEYFDIAYERII